MNYIVKDIIPHREPILLVDEIIEYKKEGSIKAKRYFPENDPCFKGHFPNFPVLPGVLSVEALAQTGGCFVNITKGKTAKEAIFLFMSVESAKFRNPVQPNTTLTFDVEVIKNRGDVYKFKGVVTDDKGKIITESVFTAKWVAKNE